jgi:hypothetical protein
MRKRKALSPLDRNTLPRLPYDGDFSASSWAKKAASSSKTPKISNRGSTTASTTKPPKPRSNNDNRNKSFVTTRRRKGTTSRDRRPALKDTKNAKEQPMPKTNPRSMTDHITTDRKVDTEGELDGQKVHHQYTDATAATSESGESRNDTPKESATDVPASLSNGKSRAGLLTNDACQGESKVELAHDDMDCASDSDSLSLDSSPEKNPPATKKAVKTVRTLNRDTLERKNQQQAGYLNDHSDRPSVQDSDINLPHEQGKVPKAPTEGIQTNSSSPNVDTLQPMVTEEHIKRLRDGPADDESVFRLVLCSDTMKTQNRDNSPLIGSEIGVTELRRSDSLDESEISSVTMIGMGRESVVHLTDTSQTLPDSRPVFPRLPHYSRKNDSKRQTYGTKTLQTRSFEGRLEMEHRYESDSSIEEWSIADDSASVPIEFLVNKRKYLHPPLPPGWKVKVSHNKARPFYQHPDFGTTWHCPVVLPPKSAAVVYRRTRRHKEPQDGKGDRGGFETQLKDDDSIVEKFEIDSKASMGSSSEETIPQSMSDLIDCYTKDKPGRIAMSTFKKTAASDHAQNDGYDGSESSAFSDTSFGARGASSANDWMDDDSARKLELVQRRNASCANRTTLRLGVRTPRTGVIGCSVKPVNISKLSPIEEDTEVLISLEGCADKIKRKSPVSVRGNTSSSRLRTPRRTVQHDVVAALKSASSHSPMSNVDTRDVDEQSDERSPNRNTELATHTSDSIDLPQYSNRKDARKDHLEDTNSGQENRTEKGLETEHTKHEITEALKTSGQQIAVAQHKLESSRVDKMSSEKGASTKIQSSVDGSPNIPKDTVVVNKKCTPPLHDNGRHGEPKLSGTKKQAFDMGVERIESSEGTSIKMFDSKSTLHDSFLTPNQAQIFLASKMRGYGAVASRDTGRSSQSNAPSKTSRTSALRKERPLSAAQKDTVSPRNYEIVGSSAFSRRKSLSERGLLVASATKKSKTPRKIKLGSLLSSSESNDNAENIDTSETTNGDGRMARVHFHVNNVEQVDRTGSNHDEEMYDDEWSPPRNIAKSSDDSPGNRTKLGDESFCVDGDPNPGIPGEENWKSPGFSAIDAGSTDDSYASPLYHDIEHPAGPGTEHLVSPKLQTDKEDTTGANSNRNERSRQGEHCFHSETTPLSVGPPDDTSKGGGVSIPVDLGDRLDSLGCTTPRVIKNVSKASMATVSPKNMDLDTYDNSDMQDCFDDPADDSDLSQQMELQHSELETGSHNRIPLENIEHPARTTPTVFFAKP